MKDNASQEKKNSNAAANQVVQKKSEGRSLPSRASVQLKKDEELQQTTRESASENLASANNSKLPASVQMKMEGAFNQDFSDVSIHTNSGKASALGAKAYTQGQDIHFASGKYDPTSHAGQQLIGHELTHVVQQRAGRVATTAQRGGVGINDDKGLEQEADTMGSKAANTSVSSEPVAQAKFDSASSNAPVQMDLTEEEKKFIAAAKPGAKDQFLNFLGNVAETVESPVEVATTASDTKQNSADFLTGVKGKTNDDSYAGTLKESTELTRDLGVAGAVGGLTAGTVGGVKKIVGAKGDYDRGKFDKSKGGKGMESVVTGAGRGLSQAADITNSALKTTQAISLVTGNAASFTAAGAGLGPLAMITSGFQGVRGVHNARLNSKRQSKAEELAKRDDSALEADKQITPEQRELFTALAENKKDKKKKGMVDAALGAGGMVAAGLMLNPVTAPAGLAIGATLGLGQAAFSLFKYIRQKGRDKADDNEKKSKMSSEDIVTAKTAEYKAKIDEGKNSRNPWKKHQAGKAAAKLKKLEDDPEAFGASKKTEYEKRKEGKMGKLLSKFDANESTANQEKRMEGQAEGLQGMSSNPDLQQEALQGIMGINKYEKGEDGKVAMEEVDDGSGNKVMKPKTTPYYENLIFKLQNEAVRKQSPETVAAKANELSAAGTKFESERDATKKLAAAFGMDDSAAEKELIMSKLK